MSAIEVTIIDRKWMRAAHAWRVFLELPDSPDLAASLSGMIDTQCSIALKNETTKVLINPAYIVDVPSKGKRFLLVVETVYEHQNTLGPQITQLYGQTAQLKIGKATTSLLPPEEPLNEEKRKLLKGLHILFQNPRFQEFCHEKYIGTWPEDEDHKACKTAFKEMLNVKSCKELSEETINSWRNNFNEWLNRGRNGTI